LISVFRAYLSESWSALNLALLRILTCVLLLVNPPTFQFVTTLPPTLPFPPPGFGWVVDLITTNPAVVGSLWCAFIAACICGALGLWSRASLWVVGLLSLYLLGLKYCFIKVDHDLIHLPYAAMILANSRCGDVLSLDRLPGRDADWAWFRYDARAESNDYALPLPLPLAADRPGLLLRRLLEGGPVWAGLGLQRQSPQHALGELGVPR
jgi:hypothetical protein